MASQRLVPFVLVLLTSTSPALLAAQERDGRPEARMAWPGATIPADVVEAIGVGQERPLPVYDDAGELIPLSEIEAEVDPSGAAGMFWVGLLGATLGAAVGAAAAPGECSYIRGGYQYYCSPREEALRTAYPAAFAIIGGALGAWMGWSVDQVSFDEALAKIRRRRQGDR